MQAPFEDPVVNGVSSETNLEQLTPGNDAMLPFGERPCTRARSWNV
jgi:hypothetical protein